MTLGELKQVIDVTLKEDQRVLHGILDTYRAPGNTLVFPFINEGQVDLGLTNNTLLDITHEALIRNWDRLRDWTIKEHNDVQDFKELLMYYKRWKEDDFNDAGLLSEGVYQYFINRHGEQLAPRAAWIARYYQDKVEISDGRSLKEIESERLHVEVSPSELELGIEKLVILSRDNIVARKKKRRRIVYTISILCAIAVLTSIWAYYQKSLALKSEKLALQLNVKIAKTSKANSIATEANSYLAYDPTLAYRIAEASYQIEPTRLNKQVLMSSYSKMPFYSKLSGHRLLAMYAEYSPNGNYIVSASYDGMVKLWDSKGILLQNMRQNGSCMPTVKSATFSPNGKHLISFCNDTVGYVWDLTGTRLYTIVHNGTINSISWNVDGSRLLSASSDSSVCIWTNKCVLIKKIFVGTPVESCVFVNDKEIIVGCSNGLLRKYNTDGRQIFSYKSKKGTMLSVHAVNEMVYSVAHNGEIQILDRQNNLQIVNPPSPHTCRSFLSNDGKIFLANNFNDVLVYKASGELITTLRGHDGHVWYAEVSPDNTKIISCSDDGTAKLWDINGNELMTLRGHTSQVFSARFSPDGKNVVTASGDKTVRIWNIKPKEIPKLSGHSASVTDIDFSPDGTRIITTGADYKGIIWNIDGEKICELKGHEVYGVTAGIYISNSKVITATTRKIRIWETSMADTILLDNAFNLSYDIKLNTEKNYILAAANFDASLILMDTLGNPLFSFENSAWGGFYNYDNLDIVYTFSEDSSLYFWRSLNNLDSVEYVRYIQLKLPGAYSVEVGFSRNYNYMVTLGSDSIIRIWNANEILINNLKKDTIRRIGGDQTLKLVATNNSLKYIKFAPKENIFITVGYDNIIRIWDTDLNLLSECIGHSAAVTCITFSPDGKLVASCSIDKSVRLWDLQGNLIQIYSVHTHRINKVKFSADGNYILTCSDDHTARLLPISVDQVIHKINIEKVRGEVYQLSLKDKEVFGILEKD